VTGGAVYATGGGSRSDVWTQCRADATGRVFHRPKTAESAFGSAILAATGAHYGNLAEAIRGMVRAERTFEPTRAVAAEYDDMYGRFVAELTRRGYLTGS
jgi:sugar (pentulose or hexulose) kinase